MANQIARNFAAQGEGKAVLATADHIAAFWDPAMRARLLGGARTGLQPIAAAAADLLQARGGRSDENSADWLATTGASGGSDAG